MPTYYNYIVSNESTLGSYYTRQIYMPSGTTLTIQFWKLKARYSITTIETL